MLLCLILFYILMSTTNCMMYKSLLHVHKVKNSFANRLASFSSAGDAQSKRINNKNKYMEVATKLWVERFVFGEKLCPWAGSSLIGNKMKIKTVYGDGTGENMIFIADEIIQESKKLYERKFKKLNPTTPSISPLSTSRTEKSTEISNELSNKISNELSTETTTLIILPDYKNFDKFLDLIDIMNSLFEDQGIDKYIQLAHFHPDYRFQDSPSQDDADNYTNRSPFPVFHLLKVEEVTKAINDYGDTSMIWKNNKKVMNQLGVEKLKEINKKILVDAKNECDAK